ncbi:hypothetical protein DFH07DRAFT_830574 [Mycena maculata]|uniref:Uncharacterized protein n=1 Tax=Mycena maculata TaxID=230809 RepID=A0AAD7N6W5_9AGAR|nr:hypothetical protein DFH07DRAFT_830574 [Mycena maculata]
MHFSPFTKIVLLCTSLAFQAHARPWFPTVAAGDFGLIQGLTAALARLRANTNTPPTVGPFVPSADNLIVNTPATQGEFGTLGWTFPSEGREIGRNVFDGFAKNITVLYTPPDGVERLLIGLLSGPDQGLCGFAPGSSASGVLDSSVLGTYTGRWIVAFGQSTQPDAPVDPATGCGPVPFNITTVEFVRTWEVVAAA